MIMKNKKQNIKKKKKKKKSANKLIKNLLCY